MALLKPRINPAVEALRDSRPVAACSLRGCNAAATLSFHGENYCRTHYEEAVSRAAERFCDDLGLKTVAEMKAYCRTRKLGASDPRGWIQDIITRYESGEYRFRANYVKACEAAGREPIECPPA